MSFVPGPAGGSVARSDSQPGLCAAFWKTCRAAEWDLVATLIRETVTAIDIGVIADGLQRHAWSEPQLAALQDQLKKINFVSDMKQVMLAGPARVSDFYPNATAFNLGEIYFGGFLLAEPTPGQA